MSVERRPPGRPVRPRPAASLVVVDAARGAPRVLMGCRRAASRFMPGWYVFPGGRVDREDARAASSLALAPATERALAMPPVRARAFALAALRETYEETGLMVARRAATPVPTPGVGDFWRACAERGLIPDARDLVYIARAITPASSPRRFDARFFLVTADRVEGELVGNGELVDLRWVPLDDHGDLPIADVTAFVLDQAARALRHGLRTPERVPRLSYVGERSRVRFA